MPTGLHFSAEGHLLKCMYSLFHPFPGLSARRELPSLLVSARGFAGPEPEPGSS